MSEQVAAGGGQAPEAGQGRAAAASWPLQARMEPRRASGSSSWLAVARGQQQQQAVGLANRLDAAGVPAAAALVQRQWGRWRRRRPEPLAAVMDSDREERPAERPAARTRQDEQRRSGRDRNDQETAQVVGWGGGGGGAVGGAGSSKTIASAQVERCLAALCVMCRAHRALSGLAVA